MQILEPNKAIKVRVGPFVDVGDGFTPQIDITLAGDEAELLKNDGAATVDISGRTWAAIAGCRGWYDLSLTASDTDTVGLLTVVVQDDSDCRPVSMDFMVDDQLDVHVWYVDGTPGSDANSGHAPGTAKATVDAAIQAASAGDKIIVAPGTYAEVIDGSGTDGLTLQGYGWSTIITSSDSTQTLKIGDKWILSDIAVINTYGSDVTGEGLAVLGSLLATSCHFSKCYINGVGGGLQLWRVPYISIKDSIIIAKNIALRIRNIGNVEAVTFVSNSRIESVGWTGTGIVTGFQIEDYIVFANNVRVRVHRATSAVDATIRGIFVDRITGNGSTLNAKDCSFEAESDSGSYQNAFKISYSGTTTRALLENCRFRVSGSAANDADIAFNTGTETVLLANCDYDPNKVLNGTVVDFNRTIDISTQAIDTLTKAAGNGDLAAVKTKTDTIVAGGATAAALTTHDAKLVVADTVVDAIKAKTDNLPGSPAAIGSAMTLVNDAITSAKYDESTAFPLKSADASTTEVARRGAGSETLASVKAGTQAAILASDGLDTVATTEPADITSMNFREMLLAVYNFFFFKTTHGKTAPGAGKFTQYKANSTSKLCEQITSDDATTQTKTKAAAP